MVQEEKMEKMTLFSDMLLSPPNLGFSPGTPLFSSQGADPRILNLPVGKAARSTALCPGRDVCPRVRRRAGPSIGRQQEEVRWRQRRRQGRGERVERPGLAGRGRRQQVEGRGPRGQRRQRLRGRLGYERRAAAGAHRPGSGSDRRLRERRQRQVRGSRRWRRQAG